VPGLEPVWDAERGQLCPIAIAANVRASSADVHLQRERSMAMKIDRIQPAGMNVRIQQGKPAYSHVVMVTGPGKTIYIAGQLARDAEGNIVGPGDMRGAARTDLQKPRRLPQGRWRDLGRCC
jgi:enamine deaminase RidA (YjgF/YER057c/UK114 family)